MTVPAGSPQYSGSERRDAHPAQQAAGQPAGGLVAGTPLGSSYRLLRRVGSGAAGEVWAATMSGWRFLSLERCTVPPSVM